MRLWIDPKKGSIIPVMGSNEHLSIAAALFTGTQQRVLGLLFGRAGQSFHTNEIVRLAQSGGGAVSRELKKLAAAGLVTVNRRGNQTLYQVNPDSPVFSELRALVVKTMGVADQLRQALSPFAEQITFAFIYGSVARGTEGADSDVDLLVVSDTLAYGELYGALTEVETVIGRKVSPTLYSRADWRKRLQDDNPFVAQLMAQPRIDLIGDEHGVAESA